MSLLISIQEMPDNCCLPIIIITVCAYRYVCMFSIVVIDYTVI